MSGPGLGAFSAVLSSLSSMIIIVPFYFYWLYFAEVALGHRECRDLSRVTELLSRGMGT